MHVPYKLVICADLCFSRLSLPFTLPSDGMKTQLQQQEQATEQLRASVSMLERKINEARSKKVRRRYPFTGCVANAFCLIALPTLSRSTVPLSSHVTLYAVCRPLQETLKARAATAKSR